MRGRMGRENKDIRRNNSSPTKTSGWPDYYALLLPPNETTRLSTLLAPLPLFYG